MRLFIVRHGETVENAARIVMGQQEGRLSPTGKEQARTIAHRLREEPMECIYSSDLLRASETAGILHDELGCNILIDTRLREQHLGEFEGKPLSILLRHMKKTGEGFISLNPPGGERSEEFRGRVDDFFREMGKRHRKGSIMMVTHHGVINVLLTSLLGKALGLFAKDLLAHGVILLVDVDAKGAPTLKYSIPMDKPHHWNWIRGEYK